MNNLNNNNNDQSKKNGVAALFGDGVQPFGGQVSQLSFGAQPVARGAAVEMPTNIDPMSLIQAPVMGGMAKQQHTHVQQQVFAAPLSGMAELGNAPNGLSKGKAPQIMVLPSVGQQPKEMDFSEFAQAAPMHFVASKCVGTNGGGLQATPAMYSELTSIVVDESPEEVLSKFTALLTAFSHDIDFKVDADNFEIHGTVFVKHFAVFFKISIWSEDNDGDRTRFECRRQKGDTFGFSEFWTQIEDQLYRDFTNARGARSEKEEEFGGYGDDNDEEDADDGLSGLGDLPPLDYSLGGLDMSLIEQAEDEVDDEVDEKASGMTPKDLDNFVYDMQQWDPSVVYSIAMLLDAFQVQGQFVQMVLNHAAFIKCILESALSHQDTALVRGALITLEKLCETQSGADLLVSYDVLDRVVPLLNHRCELIRKYTVRVLSALSSASSWKFNNARMAAFAQHSVAQCRGKWTTNDFIKSEMFEAIESKLVAAN